MDYNTIKPQLEGFDGSSRVWVYQADRDLSGAELEQMQVYLDRFTDQWVAHNHSLKAKAIILEGRFVLLMVDESQAGASGCSIDASVNFLKQLQAEFGLDLFGRMTFAYVDGDAVHFAPKDDFASLYKTGQITDDTLVVDTLIKTKADLLQQWIKPLSQSWHRRMV